MGIASSRTHDATSRFGAGTEAAVVGATSPLSIGLMSRPSGACIQEGTGMLWTIFVILLVMWLLGMVSAYTLGGYIHLLLVLAIVVALVRLIQGRRPI